jgi:hypothetical protein
VILSGTTNNCAGGRTPWNTWLSCEEITRGTVFETYPLGGTAAARPAMGRFHLGHRARPGRLAHRHPPPDLRRQGVQRRRGLLLRQRQTAATWRSA